MLDQMPWSHGEALGSTNGRDGGGTDGREGQLMAQNRPSSSREVDNKRMAEGVQVFMGRRRHGIKNGLIHRW